MLKAKKKNILENFGAFVKAKRKEKKWTQLDLAKKLGVSRASVANLEGARQGLSLLTYMKVMNAFGVDLSKRKGTKNNYSEFGKREVPLLPKLEVKTHPNDDSVLKRLLDLENSVKELVDYVNELGALVGWEK